jgi:hypothetical protein
VNLLASHMGPLFAQAAMDSPGVTVHDAPCVLNTSGPAGRWAVVTNSGRDEITTARVSLPDGKELTVPLEPIGAAAVPVGLKLNQGLTLDYCNCTPLGLFGERVLVLHAPAGWEVTVSIKGKELHASVPEGDEPAVAEHEGLTVVLATSDLAMRTWWVDDTLVFGPRFVGETIEDAQLDGANSFLTLSVTDGKLTRHKSKPAARSPAAARLGAWRRVSVCREPVGRDLAWEKMDRPRSTEALGHPYGYVWYRLEFQDVPPGRKNLFLPDCSDRATLYLNGKLLGTWGRGPEAVRTPIPATFRAGKNALTALVDNLGRMQSGPAFGEFKGLYGHVYDAEPLPVKFRLERAQGFPRRIVPRQHLGDLPALERLPVWEAVAVIPLAAVTPLHLSFAGVPHPVAVMCNERTAGFFPAAGANFGDVTLGAELKKGRNTLKVLFWGEVTEAALESFSLHSLNEALSQKARWSFRALAMPTPGGRIVGKDQPAWYVSKFTCDDRAVPLFLHVAGAKKGQIFLNGHNVGRFWTLGPQEVYYLPACWLQHNNEVMLFEEQGNIPRRSRLEFRPLGPYRQ